MRNITIVFILTCLLFLTGCTTEVEPDERVLYTVEEITETVEEIEPFEIEPFKIKKFYYYSNNNIEYYEIEVYRIDLVPEDQERYKKLTNSSDIYILSEDYKVLKNKKTTTLTLDEIKTLENNLNSYNKKLEEERIKEANRERTPEEIYGSY